MGGGNSKNQAISKINKDQWQTIDQNNGIQIVKSNKGFGQGQIRIIPLDSKRNLDQQLEIYNYRNKQNNALISCYGAEPLAAQSTTMCGNQKNIKVITERIPKRWSQLPQLTFCQTIYGLSQSLRGFEDLHEKAGPFQITQDMIGINNEGHIKVWSNQNFAQNHPTDQKPVLQITGNIQTKGNPSQKQMVQNIINVIQERCEEGRYPGDFKERILRNAVSFEDAQDEVERYSRQKNLFIPELIHPDQNLVVTKQLKQFPVYENIENIKQLHSGIPYESKIKNNHYQEKKYIPNQVITTTQYKNQQPIKYQTRVQEKKFIPNQIITTTEPLKLQTYQTKNTFTTNNYQSSVPINYQTNPIINQQTIKTKTPIRTTIIDENIPKFNYQSSMNPPVKYQANTQNYKYQSTTNPIIKYQSSFNPNVKYQSSTNPIIKYQSSTNPIIKYQSSTNPNVKYQSTNNYVSPNTYESYRATNNNVYDFQKNPNIVTTQSIYQPKAEEVTTTNRFTYTTTQNVTNKIQTSQYRNTAFITKGQYQNIGTQGRQSDYTFTYGSQVKKF